MNGPLHTNDSLGICGSPTFGRTSADSIEASGTPPGWFSICSPSSPNFVGSYVTSAPILTPPPSNQQLANIAQPSLQVHRPDLHRAERQQHDRGDGQRHDRTGRLPLQRGRLRHQQHLLVRLLAVQGPPIPARSGCGNVYVHGNYSGQLTIAAENDVIVDGDLIQLGRRDARPGRQQLRPRLPPVLARTTRRPDGMRQRCGPARSEPHGRRRDPRHQPLLHRRPLQLRRPARHADRATERSRRSSAARSGPPAPAPATSRTTSTTTGSAISSRPTSSSRCSRTGWSAGRRANEAPSFS